MIKIYTNQKRGRKMTLYEKRIAPKKGSITRFTPYYYEDVIKQTIKKIKEKIKKYIDYSSNMLDEDYLGIMSIIEEEMGKELYEEGK